MSEVASALVQSDKPVEAWLRTLPERKRAAVLAYTGNERSVVLSYLYASLLGLQLGIEDWEAWAIARYKKLDHRAMLETEIVEISNDISQVRTARDEGRIRAGEAPRKIADLNRELRGHAEFLAKDIATHDKRSLLLAGVEVTSKMLRKVFGRDGNVWPAIEAAVEAAWADIETRHQAK